MTSHPAGLFMGPGVLDKRVKFHDPSLNLSREIPPETVEGGIFDCFPTITSDREKTMTSYPVRLSLDKVKWFSKYSRN